jgi:hypothetical protein
MINVISTITTTNVCTNSLLLTMLSLFFLLLILLCLPLKNYKIRRFVTAASEYEYLEYSGVHNTQIMHADDAVFVSLGDCVTNWNA